MTTDVTKAIEPKSDQLNADDLLTGPRTIKIRDVKVQSGKEQPVWIYFEGDSNKPWKPSKSATRCLAMFWGADSSQWIGLRCTIWRDPEITWAGAKVGGIMPSHLEGLKSAQTVLLTKTRGSKKPTVLKPLDVRERPVTPTPVESETLDLSALAEEAAVAKTMTREEKRAWWDSKTSEEQAALSEMAKSASA